VGQLQLDVVAHRLEGEYAARARMIPSSYKLARGVTAEDPAELERFIEANAYRVAYDVVDAPAVLYSHQAELKAAKEIWPKIQFHNMREHGGLVVHSNRIAA
jgi:peptide chain release factor 3